MSGELDQLSLIAVFVRVVEDRSFTAAAATLGLAKSSVSDRIARLERMVGVRLLHRNTRSVAVTPAGAAFHKSCVPILAAAKMATEAASERVAEPRGLLRVTAPGAATQMHLMPAVVEFLRQYPRIELELISSDRALDLVREEIDLAIRVTDAQPAGLVARRLGVGHLWLCASPAYLRKHGVPVHPRDLDRHNCLRCTTRKRQDRWTFTSDGEAVDVLVRGSFVADDGLCLRQAVLSGLGIGLLPSMMVEEDLARGTLTSLLENYHRPPLGIYAVYPERKQLPRRVRVFIDFLAEWLKGDLRKVA